MSGVEDAGTRWHDWWCCWWFMHAKDGRRLPAPIMQETTVGSSLPWAYKQHQPPTVQLRRAECPRSSGAHSCQSHSTRSPQSPTIIDCSPARCILTTFSERASPPIPWVSARRALVGGAPPSPRSVTQQAAPSGSPTHRPLQQSDASHLLGDPYQPNYGAVGGAHNVPQPDPEELRRQRETLERICAETSE